MNTNKEYDDETRLRYMYRDWERHDLAWKSLTTERAWFDKLPRNHVSVLWLCKRVDDFIET